MSLMPLLTRTLCAATACVCAISAQSAESGSSPAKFGAEVGLGVEYDSNVSVSEVDLSSSEGDYALTMDASFDVKKVLSPTLDVAASYDFSQTNYDEFSLVDRQTHILGTDMTVNANLADTGLSLYYIDSSLDGKGFLEFYRASPFVSGFVARNWFARGAYVYSEKSIQQRPERDADTHSLEGDVYFFRRGLRSYFNLGYRFKDENAQAAFLDYKSNSVKLRYIHRFDIFTKLAKLELSWRYEDRDYRSETPGLDEDREDDRHRIRVDLEVPMIGGSAVEFYYGYARYESNSPVADYNQTIVGTRFSYSW